MPRAIPLCLTLLPLASCTLPAYDPATSTQLDPLHLIASDPADGTRGVSLVPDVVLTFDGLPDPGSVATFGPLSLRSGTNSYDYLARVDLVGRAVLLRPRTPLFPDTTYVVHVQPTVRSLDGRALEDEELVRFVTAPLGTTPTSNRREPTPRSLATDVQPLFDAHCAYAGCHDPATRAGTLDLSSATQSRLQLVDVPSVQARMARVTSSDPANSYLLRKLLGAPGIAGQPMPVGGRLADADLRAISDWIATQAPP